MVELNQSERAKCSGKYALCSDIFPTLSPNLAPRRGTIHSKWMRVGRFHESVRAVDTFYCVIFVLFCFLSSATCSSLMNSASGRISSHDSPPPPGAGNGGRRRTCWREMCWLKSTEVEDKKIISRRVSLYFGIYQSTFVFNLNSRFFMSYFENIYLFFFWIFFLFFWTVVCFFVLQR